MEGGTSVIVAERIKKATIFSSLELKLIIIAHIIVCKIHRLLLSRRFFLTDFLGSSKVNRKGKR